MALLIYICLCNSHTATIRITHTDAAQPFNPRNPKRNVPEKSVASFSSILLIRLGGFSIDSKRIL